MTAIALDADVLDTFNEGTWILLKTTDKTKLIKNGSKVLLNKKEFVVSEVIGGQRQNRVALRLNSYQSLEHFTKSIICGKVD